MHKRLKEAEVPSKIHSCTARRIHDAQDRSRKYSNDIFNQEKKKEKMNGSSSSHLLHILRSIFILSLLSSPSVYKFIFENSSFSLAFYIPFVLYLSSFIKLRRILQLREDEIMRMEERERETEREIKWLNDDFATISRGEVVVKLKSFNAV